MYSGTMAKSSQVIDCPANCRDGLAKGPCLDKPPLGVKDYWTVDLGNYGVCHYVEELCEVCGGVGRVRIQRLGE